MFKTVSGYYNGECIVLDENAMLRNGQKVRVVILEEDVENILAKPLDFSKFRMNKEHNFPMDAQEYVKELRTDDRL